MQNIETQQTRRERFNAERSWIAEERCESNEISFQNEPNATILTRTWYLYEKETTNG